MLLASPNSCTLCSTPLLRSHSGFCQHSGLQVKATMQRFEERIFGLLRNFVGIGCQDPALLTAIMRIVEMQEHVDRQIQASSQGLCSSAYTHGQDMMYPATLNRELLDLLRPGLQPKGYLRRCALQISQCVSDLFEPLLRQTSLLQAAGASTSRETRELLSQVHA